MRVEVIAAAIIAVAVGLSMTTFDSSNVTGLSKDAISYTEGSDVVKIETRDVDIAINKVFPAVAVRPVGSDDVVGYGMTISSVIGYNETVEGLALDDAHYHASFEHSTWTVDEPVSLTDQLGEETLTITMRSSVNINKRLIFGGGNPDQGSPGLEIIEDWATVTVTFTIASANYSSHYDVMNAPDYLVNGSSELKFDVRIDFNEAIDADHITLDIGLMKMDFGTFEPTAMPEAYLFHGYQSDEVSISDPLVNETDGDVAILHEFDATADLKQMFTFVEGEKSPSYFSWANRAQLITETAGTELEDTDTYYRTDGNSLRVYIATPITSDMISILHDPSLGMFEGDGRYVRLPDSGIIGSSAMAMTVGILIGLAAAGGATVVVVMRKFSSDDSSPEELVSLEKNRYFKGK